MEELTQLRAHVIGLAVFRGAAAARNRLRLRAGRPGTALEQGAPGRRLPGGRKETADVPRARINDEKTHRKLREKDVSSEKAARIVNAAPSSSRHQAAAKGGKSPSHDDFHKEQLLTRPREIGITDRFAIPEKQLAEALCNH